MAQVKKTERKPRVGDGTPGPGRPKGSTNKTTVVLKDAIIRAAEVVGQDGKGKAGLVGYLVKVANEDTKAFATLLGKVLPLQVTGAGGGALVMQFLAEDKDA